MPKPRDDRALLRRERPLPNRNIRYRTAVYYPISSSSPPVKAHPTLISSLVARFRTRHAQRRPAFSSEPHAVDGLQRRDARVISFKLHFCDILRGVFYASVTTVFPRILYVAASLHAVEHVQRPVVRLAQRFQIWKW